MAIMSLLAANSDCSFTEIKAMLGLTDGNLSVHLSHLQKAGYIAISKSFVNRRPQTSCRLTEAGRKAFQEYLGILETIIQASKKTDP